MAKVKGRYQRVRVSSRLPSAANLGTDLGSATNTAWPGSVSAMKRGSSAQHNSTQTCIYRVPGDVHTWGSLTEYCCFSTSPVPEVLCLSAVCSPFCDFYHLSDLSYFKRRGRLSWFLEKWLDYLSIYEDWIQLSCFTTSVFLDMF